MRPGGHLVNLTYICWNVPTFHLRLAMAELRVGSRELKARLGRYVRIVKEGGSVTLTEWGRPVARLVPVVPGEGGPPLDQRLEALVRVGKLVHRGGARPQPRSPRASLRGGKTLSDLIVEERDSHPEVILGMDQASDPLP